MHIFDRPLSTSEKHLARPYVKLVLVGKHIFNKSLDGPWAPVLENVAPTAAGSIFFRGVSTAGLLPSIQAGGPEGGGGEEHLLC